MAVDIYALCPCGSGKKLKFCCHAIAEEMDRIARLVEGNQPRVALQQLEMLAKKHPQNPWIGTTRGMLLLDLNEGTTARDSLKSTLEDHPDNELAIVLYAAAMIRAEGFENAKRAIHRAFQKSAKKLPSLVSDLASSMAAAHASHSHLMAAREHLALALRLAPEERRQELFVQLLDLDGADEIPYPLRGSHLLPNINGTEEQQKEVRKAQKYAAIGCWSIAADVFTTLANALGEQPQPWHAVGLCRAWDGDEKAAAEALHRAARHYDDFGLAVECETIAQLLDQKTTNDVAEECAYRANTSSVSRLLTALDAQPRLFRMKVRNEADAENQPVAAYVIMDRDKSGDGSQVTIESIPRRLAQVAVFDADPKTNEPASLTLFGLRGPNLDDAKSLFATTAGELVEWQTEGTQPTVVNSYPAETQVLDNHWVLFEQIPVVRRRELYEQFWAQIIQDKWPQQPLRALGGKTPQQAISDPSLNVALMGAIYALDSEAERREKGLHLSRVFERLNLKPLPPIEVTEETSLGSLSIMQLHRLPIEQLNDQQLITVVNRSMLIRHDETLHRVLTTAVSRPAVAEQLDLARVYRSLAEISAEEGRRDEAFSWLDKGRQLPVPDGKSAFQHAWTWDMAELGTRLENPNDPQLKVLLGRFVNYYGPKVPQIRPLIEQTLQAFGVASPWESIDFLNPVALPTADTTWSAGGQEPVSSGGSKLWLPGQ